MSVALLRALTDLVLLGFYFSLIRQGAGWQVTQLAILGAVLLAADLAGVALIWRGAQELGVSVILLSLLAFGLVAGALFSGMGLILGLTVIILTALTALLALPGRPAGRFILLGLLVGVLLPLLDEFLPTTSRLAVPLALRTFFPAVAGVLAILYGLLAARQFSDLDLRTKLVAIFLLVALIPLGILSLLNLRATRSALTDTANQVLLGAAVQTAADLDTFLSTRLNATRTEARLPGFADHLAIAGTAQESGPLRIRVSELLATLQGKDPGRLLAYHLLDTDGLVVASTQDLSEGLLPLFLEASPPALESHRQAMQNGLAWVSPVIHLPQDGGARLFFTAPVQGPGGAALGSLVAEYDAGVLQELVAGHNAQAGAESYGLLLDENRLILGHGLAPDSMFSPAVPLETDEFLSLQRDARIPQEAVEETTAVFPGLQAGLEAESPYFTADDAATGAGANQAAVAALESVPWTVVFFQPQEVQSAPILRQTRLSTLLALAVASLMTLAALGAAQLVTKPITRLTAAAVEVAAGNLETQAEVEGKDEIGALADTFNTMTARLRQMLTSLEEQVADRTQALERRARQLQIASQIGGEAAAIRDIQQLLDRATKSISRSFDFYHCGLFLIDELGEYAVLKSASSEGGQRMLARRHRLPVGRLGIVGHVAQSGEPRIALDVGADAVYFNNPDLPQTRSEMALPLKVGERLIGILDVQSTQESAFNQEDTEVLQLLADQIALAIENTILLEESKKSLRELEALYSDKVQQAWQQRLARPLAYRYNRIGVEPVSIAGSMAGQASGDDSSDPEGDERHLVAAITLHGQRLGRIHLRRDPEQEPWTREEQVLLEEVVSQFGMALENTRLAEETRRQAEREHTLSQLSASFTSSMDVDMVLRTAVTELGRLPQIDEVAIELNDSLPSGSENGGGQDQSPTNSDGDPA
jgi:nitrate/nitrite-specific signal transduction histidine kinase